MVCLADVGDSRMFPIWLNWLVSQMSKFANWFFGLKIAGVSVGAVAIIGLVISLVVYFLRKGDA